MTIDYEDDEVATPPLTTEKMSRLMSSSFTGSVNKDSIFGSIKHGSIRNGSIKINNEVAVPLVNRWDLVWDFNGSIGFIIGSSGFAVSTYKVDWLPHYRYGCILWIWGCLAYLAPVCIKLSTCTNPLVLGDIGLIICMLC